MKAILALVIAFATLLGGVPLLAALTIVAAPVKAADICGPAILDQAETPATVEQIANARDVARAVQNASLDKQALLVTLVAAVGESDLINLDHGDTAGPDSRGILQQRDPWGTLAQRLDPYYAATSFLLGPRHDRTGGLVTVDGWQTMPLTQAIHQVQRNADPDHYTRFEPRARQIAAAAGLKFPGDPGCGTATVTLYPGPCPLDPPGAEITCEDAFAFANRQVTTGSTAWYRLCLGFVSTAYGGTFAGYYSAATAATAVTAAGGMHNTSLADTPRGALLWWGPTPRNPYGHVALYAGNGLVISNDVTGRGTIGTVPFEWFATHWGHPYLGWSAPALPSQR